jgi:hypothetical protein
MEEPESSTEKTVLRCNVSREGETIPIYLYLLSNDIRVMVRFDFECAVVCP